MKEKPEQGQKNCMNCATHEAIKALGNHPDMVSVMRTAMNCKNCSLNVTVSRMPAFFQGIWGEITDNWTPVNEH